MVKKKGTRAASRADARVPASPPAEIVGDGTGVETTGRFVVVFKDVAGVDSAAVRSTLNQVAGLRNVTTSADYASGAIAAEDLADSEVLHFEKLGVVVVSGDDAVQALAASASDADSPILAIEPEYIAYPSGLLE